MANKQIKVDLIFGADTSQAVNNINQLNQLLNIISKDTVIGVDNGSLSKAVSSARELQAHLAQAVNVDTGKLDLSKLNASLKSTGSTLQTLTNNLQAAGPAGQQAFIKVANAISQAQAPMFQLNGALKSFASTLMNTAKWQIASTAIHAVGGAMSEAVTHAKDLNRALNDIRIVTGYSDTTMASFATRASEAAKALSTTTTEYAKAALIFYQQGLSGDAVAERANTVIKLAQVTGQSASQVSDQMTAIWNNFDDGTKSLEYYADALTKLGAATAASTDEIAQGLEKFAAVAETVGLSYETAAAAVATVVDKTRQSADVVGTAFKTIFARMENLSLGETLDDGVTLNKYTEALKSVGISVLNAQGELRDMDYILADLGEKWEGFGRSTQIALAQTVGGIRQYNQMIALMDNWTNVQKNVKLAEQAGGELQKQATIWSSSYKAAAERVKQAKNDLYETFIDNNSIVKFNDVFAQLINTVTDFVDSVGGIIPLVLMIGGVFSKILLPVAGSVFKQIGNFINIYTGKALKDTIAMQQQVSAEMKSMIPEDGVLTTQQQQLLLSKELLDVKTQLSLASKTVSYAEQEEMRARVNNYEAMNLEVQKILETKQALEEEIEARQRNMNKNVNAKRDMATTGVLDKYRREHEGDPIEEIDSVIDEATNRTRSDVSAELEAEKKRIAEIENQKAEIRQRILESQQRAETANSHIQNGDNIDLNKKVDAEINLQIDLQKQLEELNSITDERKSALEEILNIQRQINEESHRNIEDISVGELDISETVPQTDTTEELNSTQRATKIAMEELDFTDNGLDVSIKNLTKLQTSIQNVKNQMEKVNAVSKDLKKSTKNLVDENGQLKTNVDKTSKEYKDAIKLFQDSREEVTNLARASGMTVDEIKDLEIAFNRLGTTEEQTGDFNTIISSLNQMRASLEGADIGLDAIAQDMLLMIQNSGNTDENLLPLISALEKLGIVTQDADGKVRQLDNAFNGLGDKPISFGSRLSTVVGQVATFAGQMQMATSAVSMLMDAFDEENSPLEIFMSVLMSMSMLLPVVKTVIDGFVKSKKESTKATVQHTVAQEADNVAENSGTLAKIGSTIATKAQTVAQWAHNAALVVKEFLTEHPAVAAATVAAAFAAAIAITAVAKAQEKENEALKEENKLKLESAEKTNELSSKWAEQMDTMDALIAKYHELKEAGEDYKTVTQDIIDQVPDLIDSYVETAKGLKIDTGEGSMFNTLVTQMENAAAAGDAESIEKLSNQMDELLSPKIAENASIGADAALSQVAYAIKDAGDANYNNNKVTRHVGGAGAGEIEAVDILEEMDIGSRSGNRGYDISLDASSVESFVEDYEKLLEAATKMETEVENLGSSDTYREVKEMLDASTEQYEKLKELQEESKKYQVYDAKIRLENSNAKIKDVKDVKNLSDYKSYKAALLKEVGDDPAAQEAVKKWLASNKSLEKYVKAERSIEHIKTITGKDKNDTTYEDFFENELTEEQKELFLKIDFNKIQSLDAIKEEIAHLQSEADLEPINKTLNFIADTKSLIKAEGMTEEEWKKVYDSGIKWGESFIGMNYEEEILGNELYEDKYNFEVSFESFTDGKDGCVFKQDPKAGSEIAKGTTIRLYVAKSGEGAVIPDFYGENYQSVCNTLESMGFIVRLIPDPTSKEAVGSVVRTDPSSGSNVFPGSNVNVYYAAAADSGTLFKMPNLMGMNLEEAKDVLDKHGLILSSTEVVDTSAKKDIIVEQSPKDGSPVQKGDNVILTVSSGKVAFEKGISIPQNVGTLSVKIELDDTTVKTDTVDTNSNSTYNVKVSGEGKSKLHVYLNDKLYYDGEVHFDKEPAIIVQETYHQVDFYINVIGMNVNEAKAALNKSGYNNITIVEQESSENPGVVINQSPSQGSAPSLDKTATIVLTVSKEKSDIGVDATQPVTSENTTQVQ